MLYKLCDTIKLKDGKIGCTVDCYEECDYIVDVGDTEKDRETIIPKEDQIEKRQKNNFEEAWAQLGKILYENGPCVDRMFAELFTNFYKYATICRKELLQMWEGKFDEKLKELFLRYYDIHGCCPDEYDDISYSAMTYAELTGYIVACLEKGLSMPYVVK